MGASSSQATRGLPRARLLLAALACLSACKDDPQLSGSVGELFPLTVSDVDILRNDEAVQITYLNNRAAALDVVARISIALKDIEFRPGTTISLAGEYTPGHERCTVIHAPGGEPVRTFSRVKRGDLRVSVGGQVGEYTSGNFSMLFEAEGGDIGHNRTLVGVFSGVARDAGFGPLP